MLEEPSYFVPLENCPSILLKQKKGFLRGGHYHEFKSEHILLQGKIEFRELHLGTNTEQIRILLLALYLYSLM